MLFCDLTGRCLFLGFPDDSVVRTPSASARDAGSIPGLGRSHLPQSSQVRGPQPPSLCSRPREPQVLSSQASLHNKGSHRDEKPEHRAERVASLTAAREKATRQRRPSPAKKKKKCKKLSLTHTHTHTVRHSGVSAGNRFTLTTSLVA